jgi:hypothetical protein
MTANIVAKAPADASYFFGFHDVTPWCPNDAKVLLHRVDPEIRHMPGPDDRAEIVLWDPISGECEVVGETTCWNFQQGARAMWIPGKGRSFVYNKRVNGLPGCEIVDLLTGKRRTLPYSIGALSPSGDYALSPNFGRLGALWPAYGYSGFESAEDKVPQPENDGLWRIDIETGDRELMFSISDLMKVKDADIAPDVSIFVTHASFNREGTRIVFMARFFSKDVALYSLIYSCYPDGSDLILIAQEKISHFDWIDETNIVLWMRKSARALAAARKSGLLASPFVRPFINLARNFRGRLKGAVLNESYFLVNTKTATKAPFMAGTLPQDGHPMVAPGGKWMIVDEYPDLSGRTPLMLVEIDNRTRVDVGAFAHDVGSDNSDLKCDLHPRWNRKGTMVGVDASENGRRCFTIVDVSGIIGR